MFNIDLAAMSHDARVRFLAVFAHEITVCARSTYIAGTLDVSEPPILRAYNELQHRVTGALRDHLARRGGIPLDVIIDMARGFATEHGRDEMTAALERAHRLAIES